MKILIFEYITGGGFCGSDLPESLAREGGLMLNALLDNFADLLSHEIVVMLDARLSFEDCDKKILINPNDDVFAIFDNALYDCDAAWIIAPETDNILFNFTKRVEKANKLLLSNPSSAIAKTADKLQTFTILTKHNIKTIPMQRLSDLLGFKNLEDLGDFPLVIKPIDGVGCENSFLIKNHKEFQQIAQKISQPQNYIIQPFIVGDALSISALFKQGQVQLICINKQIIEIKNQRFKLIACEVNIAVADKVKFQNLLNKIAQAFPDLFAYVGIDLILADDCYVLEINPRLTSSYAGIKKALGLNVADLVVQSLSGEILINPVKNETILINISS